MTWQRRRLAVAIGAKFRHVRKNNTDETGKVTPLVDASFGIPYVLYALSFKFKRALFTGGPRMLTL